MPAAVFTLNFCLALRIVCLIESEECLMQNNFDNVLNSFLECARINNIETLLVTLQNLYTLKYNKTKSLVGALNLHLQSAGDKTRLP